MRIVSILLCIALSVRASPCSETEKQSWIENSEFTMVYMDCSRMSFGDAVKTARCLEKATELSTDCSLCFGNAAKCGAKKCMLVCLRPDSLKCQECLDTSGCVEDLMVCVDVASRNDLPPAPEATI